MDNIKSFQWSVSATHRTDRWHQQVQTSLILAFKIMGDISRSSRALLQGCLATREPHVFSTHSFLVLFNMNWMFALLCTLLCTRTSLYIYVCDINCIVIFFILYYTHSILNDGRPADIFNIDPNMAFRKAQTQMSNIHCVQQERPASLDPPSASTGPEKSPSDASIFKADRP